MNKVEDCPACDAIAKACKARGLAVLVETDNGALGWNSFKTYEPDKIPKPADYRSAAAWEKAVVHRIKLGGYVTKESLCRMAADGFGLV